MVAYTYASYVPGFGPSSVNSLPFGDLVARPTENAQAEGRLFFGNDFVLSTGQVGKVEGDVFELLEASIMWNVAARWNRYMRGDPWPLAPRYPRPGGAREPERQVVALSLPREYDCGAASDR